MITWPGDQESESSISVTHSVSLHVMSSCQSLTSAVWPWWLQSSVSSSTQYPVSRCPVQASRPKQSRRGKKKEKDCFSRVHQFLWCPEDQAARWDDLRDVVAVQLLRLHQHQLPLHHHCLQFHNQFTCNILPLSNTEQTIASDIKILWIFYPPHVHIFYDSSSYLVIINFVEVTNRHILGRGCDCYVAVIAKSWSYL